MPTKEYKRVVQTIFTREEMAALLKEAHEHCKTAVKPKYHVIGVKRKRSVIYRPRSEYLACIKNYIQKKIKERLASMGISA
ncbi:MAG TPA: hypothetical protein ENG46_01400 [Acidilobales archaeon]|nr:hypothetical protein [Acidilobales archaeon]